MRSIVDVSFRTLGSRAVVVLCLLTMTCEPVPSGPDVGAYPPPTAVAGARVARILEPAELGIANPAGLAYWPKAEMLLVVTRVPGTPPGQVTDIELLTLAGDRAGTVRIAAGVTDPASMAFDAKANRLLILQSPNQLIEILARPDGSLDPQTLRTIAAGALGVRDARGLAVDPASGRLFILDAAGPRILRVEPNPHPGLESASVSEIDLARIGSSSVRGLAFDPTSGHLHVLDASRALHEVTETGHIVATRDLSAFGLRDALGIGFAPSGDATDDPAEMSLYVADGGLGRRAASTGGTSFAETGHITEFSFVEPGPQGRRAAGWAAAAAVAASAPASLVQTIATSLFSPPSPDPSGITYIAHSNILSIVDGEVDEMAIYAGANVFEMSPSGNLTRAWTTLSFSQEPNGAAYNPANRYLFLSDDDARDVWVVDPGPDGLYSTSDDRVTRFDTAAFGSTDPEGVTYDIAHGVLFIADGVNAQVYRVSPGSNGVFDGVSPVGDDQVTSFDTEVLGLLDPEGIAYDTDFGHLYVVGKPVSLVFHLTTTGSLLRTIDISAAQPLKPAGLAYAPGSANPSTNTLWIVDRRVDNNDNPNENDGKVYEFSLPPFSANALPTVTITGPAAGSTVFEGDPVTLTGTASDPEDGDLTASLVWSSSLDGALGVGGSITTGTLSVGTHVITAAVTDSEGAQASSSILVTVLAQGSGIVEVRVSAGFNDAEELSSGTMDLGSGDLDLVVDGSTTQTVGVRFTGVAIPPGMRITRAYVQFQAEEATSSATALTIRGQAADNAAAFSSTTRNITSRTLTATATSWSPAPWPTVGQAGLDQQTPNVAPVVQEIVDRPGWQSGNALALIITGTGIGTRVAESYNGLASAAALLHVEYATASNTAPTASNVTITGTPAVGQMLTGSYTYSDADGDAEGSSTYRWLREGVAINGAVSTTYTLVAADQGTQIVFEVTPVAASGVSPGALVQSAAVGPVAPANTAPTASNVTIAGTPEMGQVLTGSYTYSDADGDAEGTSTYRWLRDGVAISGATATTYTLVTADQGALIVFEVTPVAATGVSPGAPVQSAAVGPVAPAPANTAPTATDVTIAGTPEVGQVLTGSYTYSDADGDAEGTSTYRWLRDGVAISGATATTYTLVAADQGALIVFEVTPVAATGVSPGAPVQSAAVGPVAGANTAPTASNVTITGTPVVGQVLTGSYTYSDADGDLEGTSTYRWLRDGVAISGATATTYTLVAADQGALIVFEVTPVAATGVSPGAPVQSAAMGPVGPAPANTAPTATDVTITGTPVVGQELTGSYTYSDADGDAEGTSTYRWLRDGVAISGPTVTTYTLVAADQGTLIVFEVTPVAASGLSPGAAVQSAAVEVARTVEVRVAASPDDAEESTSGKVSLTGSDLGLVREGGSDQTVGMRFTALTIPQGATIVGASLQFQADEKSSVATALTIRAEATDNATTFSTSTRNVSLRTTTTSAVSWSPVRWLTVGQAGPDQRTPNIAAVIQEIANRPGWASGHSLVIIITGTGRRVAESYDGLPSAAPLLRVDYTVGNP